MHPSNQQYLLTMRLFGLFIKCPFREAIQGCPFRDIRNLQSLDLKFELAEKIAVHPQCSENVCHTHEACYRNRMQQMINTCTRKPVSAAPGDDTSVRPQTALSRC